MADYSYIGTEVIKLTHQAIATFASLGFPLGHCMGKRINGDCCWFILTKDETLTSLFVLLVTPYGYLSEWRFASSPRHYGIVTDLESLALWLSDEGLRALTPDEHREFTQGSSE
jgi:hypothetical protein